MKQYMFDFDPERCVSCGACAVACMDQNDIDPEKQVPFRHVSTSEYMENGNAVFCNLSMACMHCVDAPCIQACPVGCIEKDDETGLTVYDNTDCIGCHSCVLACPFGAPSFTPEGKMTKCNGCVTRLKHGLEPACVRVCPFDALKMVPVEEAKEKQWNKIMTRIIKATKERQGNV